MILTLLYINPSDHLFVVFTESDILGIWKKSLSN